MQENQKNTEPDLCQAVQEEINLFSTEIQNLKNKLEVKQEQDGNC